MTPASDVLQSSLTDQASARRQRAAVYLNARARAATTEGRWLSEVGFASAAPFAYSVTHASNLFPNDAEGARTIDRILFIPYGLGRDAQRLRSTAPADRLFHSSRGPGRAGVAYYPGSTTLVSPADLADDTSVGSKTLAILSALRQASTGPGYHAVITRAGAVYVTAPLDARAAPVPGAETAVCVAVETAAFRLREGADVGDADFTGPQLLAMAVLVAKVRTAEPSIALALGNSGGIRYVVRAEEGQGAMVLDALTGTSGADFIARVGNENPYDLSTDVFRRSPVPEGNRAQAQAALGTEDTMGASSLLLGAYGDVAAADRTSGMQTPDRVRTFIERARVAHLEGDAGAEAAGDAAAAEQLTPVIPVVLNFSPHVYDYATGRWGDEAAT